MEAESGTSPEELKSLRLLFDKADRHNKGCLTRHQVRHLVRRIFRQEARQDFDDKYLNNYANLAFKEADTDNSRTLEFDEFVGLYKKLMSDVAIPPELKRNATHSLLKPETVVSEEDKREYLRQASACRTSKLSLVVPKQPLTRKSSSANMPEVIIRSYYEKYSRDTGHIGCNELKQLTYDLGIYLSDVEAQLVLGNLDCDGSGEVSFEEFFQWWRTERKFEKLASIETPEMQQAIQYFQYFDADRNGVVSRDEFEGLHADLVRNNVIGASTVEEAWKEVSENGLVNFNSFLLWLGLAAV